jgi:hypothetical protein
VDQGPDRQGEGVIAALVLAAALEVYTEDGCRWIRPAASTPKAKPRPAAAPASAVNPRRKPKPRQPDDELIGCDEDGPVWRSEITTVDFWPPLAPPARLDRIEPVPAAEPPTFETECDCGPAFPYWPPIFIGGGSITYQSTAIPEPSIWLAILAGLALIIRRRTA